MQTQWSFSGIWNAVLDQRQEKKTEARDRIWASELYKPDIDIFLKLKGEEPSNIPNARSLRKFQAGNIWEYIVKIILIRAGILRSTQDYVKVELEGMLPVTGKVDFIAGGQINYDDAEKKIAELFDEELPFLYQTGKALVQYFRENYPDGVSEKVIEVKSVSTFAFNKVELTGKALSGHDLQAFHYAYGTGKEAVIVYVCRDDCRIIEIPILPKTERLFERYKAKIEKVTSYYRTGEQPPLAPLFVFDEDMAKFSKNLGVEYSSFLTKLYGFKEPMEYDERVRPAIGRWNRVIGRIKKGEKMTDKNMEALAEMKGEGYDIDLITKLAKEKASIPVEEEEAE